jgi:hypothetical protein
MTKYSQKNSIKTKRMGISLILVLSTACLPLNTWGGAMPADAPENPPLTEGLGTTIKNNDPLFSPILDQLATSEQEEKPSPHINILQKILENIQKKLGGTYKNIVHKITGKNIDWNQPLFRHGTENRKILDAVLQTINLLPPLDPTKPEQAPELQDGLSAEEVAMAKEFYNSNQLDRLEFIRKHLISKDITDAKFDNFMEKLDWRYNNPFLNAKPGDTIRIPELANYSVADGEIMDELTELGEILDLKIEQA